MPVLLPSRRFTLAALVVLGLTPAAAEAHAILLASSPAAGGSVPAGQMVMEFRFNSRIDRVRSRLTLTRPDRSQAVLPIGKEGPEELLHTASGPTSRRRATAVRGLAHAAAGTEGQSRVEAHGLG